jgi:hypothetical protein
MVGGSIEYHVSMWWSRRKGTSAVLFFLDLHTEMWDFFRQTTAWDVGNVLYTRRTGCRLANKSLLLSDGLVGRFGREVSLAAPVG